MFFTSKCKIKLNVQIQLNSKLKCSLLKYLLKSFLHKERSIVTK